MEPPHGEETPHVPGPSLWPVGFAVGIACVLVGLIVSWPAVAVGALITLVFGFLWIREITTEPRPASEAATPATVAEEEEVDYASRFPRSKFLELTTLGLGGVITGIVTVPILGFMILPSFVDQELDDIDLGPLDNFPEGDWREATFLSEPAAGEVSRRTAYVRNNGELNGVPSFTIISNRCAHLGCPVQSSGPRSEEEKKVQTEAGELTITEVSPAAFSCPCHGGAYDTEGNRTAGPPVRGLDRYEFSIKGNRLILGHAYSVSKVEGTGAEAKITRHGLASPGVHVDGLERWLYPIQPTDVSS
jgi:menaquinol-cytochrome c reductase iron-sulfur subunit